jgi:hypothetical protein
MATTTCSPKNRGGTRLLRSLRLTPRSWTASLRSGVCASGRRRDAHQHDAFERKRPLYAPLALPCCARGSQAGRFARRLGRLPGAGGRRAWRSPSWAGAPHFGIWVKNGLGPLGLKLDPPASQAALMAAVHTTMLTCCPSLPLELGPVALVPAPDPLE